MPRDFSKHDFIENDIAEIYDFIAKDSPLHAQRVVEAIAETIREIKNDPERFSQFRPRTFQNDHLRRAIALPYRNYLIFFELFPDEIRVLYVHHGARDFEARHRRGRRR